MYRHVHPDVRSSSPRFGSRSLSRSMAAFRGDSQQLLRATLEPTAGCCSGFVSLLKGRRLGDRYEW